ncbi:MAG: extracellular solute-binding protein [Clostridia bacterium]|nr:extracellular solute-binding protein [Clostridia bacterium]
MKKFLSLLMAAMMLLSICSVALAEDTTIRIMWWGDTARHEKYNKIMDAFEAENPGIKVERLTATWADYWSKLPTMVAGGDAPEVMGMHAQYVADYAGRSALYDLTSLVEKGILDTTDIPASVQANGVVGGKLIGIPMGLTVQTLMINKTLCEEVGFEYPIDEVVTWSQFAELCKEFRAKALEKGIDAYLIGEVTGYTAYQYWVRSNGRDLYTADGQLGSTVEDAEGWWGYWKALRDADAIPDAETVAEAATATLEQNLFSTKRVAMFNLPVNQLWQYVAYLANDELDVCHMPKGDNGVTGAFIEGALWSISASVAEDKVEAAGKLLDFIANKEGAAQYMLMDQGVPCNTKMAEYISPMLDAPNVTAINFVNEVATFVEKGINFAPTGANAIDTVFGDCREAVAFEAMTPAEAAASFVEQANAIIEENKK